MDMLGPSIEDNVYWLGTCHFRSVARVRQVNTGESRHFSLAVPKYMYDLSVLEGPWFSRLGLIPCMYLVKELQ